MWIKEIERISKNSFRLSVTCDEVTINRKYEGYQRGLALMVYKFFDRKSAIDTATGEGIKHCRA